MIQISPLARCLRPPTACPSSDAEFTLPEVTVRPHELTYMSTARTFDTGRRTCDHTAELGFQYVSFALFGSAGQHLPEQ
jgi:hypothetical protein